MNGGISFGTSMPAAVCVMRSMIRIADRTPSFSSSTVSQKFARARCGPVSFAMPSDTLPYCCRVEDQPRKPNGRSDR